MHTRGISPGSQVDAIQLGTPTVIYNHNSTPSILLTPGPRIWLRYIARWPWTRLEATRASPSPRACCILTNYGVNKQIEAHAALELRRVYTRAPHCHWALTELHVAPFTYDTPKNALL